MGLDATVYVHRDHLPFDVDDSQARVDEETGEVFFDDPALEPPGVEFVALAKRLGNIDMIHYLAKKIKDVLDDASASEPLLLKKVLYSGSHCGDWIGLEDLARLREEIVSVLSLTEGHRSAELQTFLDDMRELADRAEEEGNPIVF